MSGRLGHKSKNKRFKETIASSFRDIDYIVGERESPLQLSIEETIVLETKEDESLYTEIEVEFQLEKTSYYRNVVYRAYLIQRRYKKQLEKQFKVWLAKAKVAAETKIIREKGPDSGFVGGKGFSLAAIANLISESKLETWVLNHKEYGKAYSIKQNKILEVEEVEFALKELADTIKDRSMILMGILRRKKEDYY